MENWKKQLRAYVDQGRLPDKRHEDMLALRILRGLGLTSPQKGLYALEQGLFGATSGDKPLWDRAKAVFERLLCTQSLPYDWMNRKWLIEPYLIKRDREMLERLSVTTWDAHVPMFFARIGMTWLCKAYVLVDPYDLKGFTPPFAVLEFREHSNLRLVVQEAQHFVSQFGPFPLDALMGGEP